jgi:Restriction endonuclease
MAAPSRKQIKEAERAERGRMVAAEAQRIARANIEARQRRGEAFSNFRASVQQAQTERNARRALMTPEQRTTDSQRTTFKWAIGLVVLAALMAPAIWSSAQSPNNPADLTLLGIPQVVGLVLGAVVVFALWRRMPPGVVLTPDQEARRVAPAAAQRPALMAQIDAMTGIEFERLLARLFQQMGYEVQSTKATGDNGADLILPRGGDRTVVQAKRRADLATAQGVRDALSSMGVYGADYAIVVSNQFFTPGAKLEAKANAVELWDRDRLTSLLNLQQAGNLEPTSRLDSLKL